MAIAMGFVQLFRGLGQVAGVSIASAIFQALLDTELYKRLPGNDKVRYRVDLNYAADSLLAN